MLLLIHMLHVWMLVWVVARADDMRLAHRVMSTESIYTNGVKTDLAASLSAPPDDKLYPALMLYVFV